MNAITQLDLLRLESLVSAYDIGELIRHHPAATGIENSNYFVTTARAGVEQHYVLTVLEQPANAGGGLVELLDACVDAGLPVPAVLRNRQGLPFTDLDGKPAMLCMCLPGRHVYNPTQRQVEALGRFLGRFHLATAAAGVELPAYPRDLHWLERGAESCRGHLGFGAAALMRDTRRQLADALARDDVAALPQGPIHADLFRDNVLFNEWGLAGVLDFHHASHGHLIYDLAVAANDWCTDTTGALDPERTLALLRAYHGIRPLRRAELWHFPVFALYGALAFWTSRLVVTLQKRRGAAVRANNPEEFERIVRHHSAHFFYLDERRLQ
ncbi:MAG: homoserine kinase [Gammaproteobacteria bacterium]|nr:homoserine kinase [Gammaproteobacteria bacterium]